MKTSIPKLHSIRMKNHENVEWLDIVTTQDGDPQNVLLGAINSGLSEVVIAGYDKAGNEYFASNKANGSAVLWLLKRMEKALLDVPEKMDEGIMGR